jgi:hypothetical protein
MSGRPADELCAGYEALRAAATGQMVCEMPRGLTLMLSQGLPAWMRAWTPLPPARPIVTAGQRPVATGVGADVVRLLTEMALGCRIRLVVS